MADDKTKVGGQDRTRINVNEQYELADWSDSLGVSRERLRAAVAAVGDRVEDVRAWLERNET